MPLFAFISGYVFIASTKPAGELWFALRKKYTRLGVPLVTASFIYNAAYLFLGDPKAVHSIFSLIFYPFLHLWFLQASLLISTFVTLFMICIPVRRTDFALGLFAFALLSSMLIPLVTTNFFSVGRALNLLPFFALGIAMRNWRGEELFEKYDPRLVKSCLATIAVAMLALGWWRSASLPFHTRSDLGSVSLSCVICVCLYMLHARQKFLEVIGPYSYTIYLFHPLFSSTTRRAMSHLLPNLPDYGVFVCCMVAGLALPITLHVLMSRSKLGAFVLLGVDPKKIRRQPMPAIPVNSTERLLSL